MKISYKWLLDYLSKKIDINQVSERLTASGLEVSNIEHYSTLSSDLSGYVVGEIKSVQPHPNADKLKLTSVDIGERALSIVCGAPNVKEGQKVAVATIGSTVSVKDNPPFKIKKAKLRGEVSEGMLCSALELGVSDDNSGLIELDQSFENGMPISECFDNYTDQIIDIDLTPNRTDAMGHFGVARDLVATCFREKDISLIPPKKTNSIKNNASDVFSVEVNSKDCLRYSGVLITEVEVKPSDKWLKNRLKAIGLNPINNIVDATNYVMHELGQPLHAFDADHIQNGIIVRKAKPKESIVTLDGESRSLSKDDLLICDHQKPLCIAGVFGSVNSGVGPDTKNIFIESACFSPVSIRKTAKRLGLSTDASYRYERGCDPNGTMEVLQRVVTLILDSAGGHISSQWVDVYPKKAEKHKIRFSKHKYESLMGHSLTEQELLSIFKGLDIEVLESNQDQYQLEVPLYRADVIREVDVIEEVARIYGFDHITPPKVGRLFSATESKADIDLATERKITSFLRSRGFMQCMTNSLVNQDLQLTLKDSQEHHIKMQNPLSAELNVLRDTLVVSQLQTLQYNQNRNNKRAQFFEFGKTYKSTPEGFIEKKWLILSLSEHQSEHWNSDQRFDFYYLKATIEDLLDSFGIDYAFSKMESSDAFDAGIQIDQEKLSLGTLKKELQKKHDLTHPVYMAQIDFNWLVNNRRKAPKYQPISKFMSAERDLAILIDESIAFDTLKESISSLNIPILNAVSVFDVYTGKGVGANKKSYALRFTLSDHTQTLSEKQINGAMSKITKLLEDKFNAQLR